MSTSGFALRRPLDRQGRRSTAARQHRQGALRRRGERSTDDSLKRAPAPSTPTPRSPASACRAEAAGC